MNWVALDEWRNEGWRQAFGRSWEAIEEERVELRKLYDMCAQEASQAFLETASVSNGRITQLLYT